MRHVGELFKIVMVVTGGGDGGGGGALGVAFSMLGFGWAGERDTSDFFEFHSESEDKAITEKHWITPTRRRKANNERSVRARTGTQAGAKSDREKNKP
jgi:hypothetical protein